MSVYRTPPAADVERAPALAALVDIWSGKAPPRGAIVKTPAPRSYWRPYFGYFPHYIDARGVLHSSDATRTLPRWGSE